MGFELARECYSRRDSNPGPGGVAFASAHQERGEKPHQPAKAHVERELLDRATAEAGVELHELVCNPSPVLVPSRFHYENGYPARLV